MKSKQESQKNILINNEALIYSSSFHLTNKDVDGYLVDSLNENNKLRVEMHLENCEYCRDMIEIFQEAMECYPAEIDLEKAREMGKEFLSKLEPSSIKKQKEQALDQLSTKKPFNNWIYPILYPQHVTMLGASAAGNDNFKLHHLDNKELRIYTSYREIQDGDLQINIRIRNKDYKEVGLFYGKKNPLEIVLLEQDGPDMIAEIKLTREDRIKYSEIDLLLGVRKEYNDNAIR